LPRNLTPAFPTAPLLVEETENRNEFLPCKRFTTGHTFGSTTHPYARVETQRDDIEKTADDGSKDERKYPGECIHGSRKMMIERRLSRPQTIIERMSACVITIPCRSRKAVGADK
jgi:hypothetical protein